jgi:hypothetical protein
MAKAKKIGNSSRRRANLVKRLKVIKNNQIILNSLDKAIKIEKTDETTKKL